jgi:gliding motility-associated protein GldC
MKHHGTIRTMTKADIHISVEREANDITNIAWQAEEAPEPGVHDAKAMILALWDAESRNSLRIDLWANDMTIDDMNDFFFQTLLSMADTYSRATNNKDIMADMKIFAREFAEKASRTAKRAESREQKAESKNL